jgi:hypothetical protein
MRILHELPYVDQFLYFTVHNLERWVCVGSLTPIGIAALIGYAFLVCARPAY